ncbi:SigB/SigF/SigG family RNA polymerase sigma factor [Streptomyces sp. AC563]|uniref:SigB/SigF/SigG family RNA polymerase sigma factor n=1 Tax=Streptomyces buecherae TaxID=2763006 RepID=UPI00164DA1FB|nr:SigB/SigF/SigG family RNA polymerase sigma factor [Streptomyces buecherae]MBC3990350.1 SigB/SigF/SigG family RNA polymerase sigma factor [Streptomyces buecherae]
MTTARVHATRSAKHPHDDAPDTAADFRRLSVLEDGPEKDALRARIIVAWIPMADRLARQFRNRGEALEDLRQVAALGLVKAVLRYDPTRGIAFESFAVPTVVGEVKRHFRDHMWELHVPRRVQELRNQVRAACRDLSPTLEDRIPGVPEIAEHTGLSQADVRLGMQALDCYAALSLDAELSGTEDGYSLVDTLADQEPGFDQVIDREAVRPVLSKLPERERRILYLRFFCDMTQSRIAEQLGISQMHVSRLINRTCSDLCDQVMDDRPRRPACVTADDPPAAAP